MLSQISSFTKFLLIKISCRTLKWQISVHSIFGDERPRQFGRKGVSSTNHICLALDNQLLESNFENWICILYLSCWAENPKNTPWLILHWQGSVWQNYCDNLREELKQEIYNQNVLRLTHTSSQLREWKEILMKIKIQSTQNQEKLIKPSKK